MKKISIILLLFGSLGLATNGLLRSLNSDSRILFNISSLFFLAGILTFLFVKNNKIKKYTFQQKIFSVIFWVGILIIFISHYFRHWYLMGYLNWDISNALRISGFCIVIGCLLRHIIILISDKLRTTPKGKPASIEIINAMGITSQDLDKFVGVYNNEKMPLKITITQFDNTLIAEATEQSSFYLEILEKNVFKYPGKDIVIEFDTSKNELILKQHGGYFYFVKES